MAVLEGARICSDALAECSRGNIGICSVFATETALERYERFADRGLFESDRDGKFCIITEQIAEKLSDTKNPQGVFAVVKMWEKKLSPELLNAKGRYAVLDNLQDPGNLGTIIRTADALGFDGAVLVNNCCELYNPKVLRSTMGSVFRLPVFTADSLEKAVECFSKAGGIKSYAAVVDADAKTVGDFKFQGGCAVVIGNEGSGLTDEDAALCTERITIRMTGNAESLNAASAAAILLWEMSKREL